MQPWNRRDSLLNGEGPSSLQDVVHEALHGLSVAARVDGCGGQRQVRVRLHGDGLAGVLLADIIQHLYTAVTPLDSTATKKPRKKKVKTEEAELEDEDEEETAQQSKSKRKRLKDSENAPLPPAEALTHAVKLVWLDRTVPYTDAVDSSTAFCGLFVGGALGLVRCFVADKQIRAALEARY